MAAPTPNIEAMPVIRDIKDFDLNSGIWLERAIFNNRLWVMLACLVVTLFLGYNAIHISLNASYERMLPYKHPYIQNFAANAKQLRGLGNTLRVVVENTQGDIFDPEYLDTLKKVNDELFLTPGVDRAWVKSIWMPVVRYNEVTEEGFAGGPVMPDTYDGSPAGIEKLKQNIAKAGLVGSLVANDYKSAMIVVPLLSTDPATGKPIDYWALSRADREERPRQGRDQGRQVQGPRHRLREADRRAARRHPAGHDVFRHRDPDRRGDPVLVHALRAQHGRRAAVLDDRGDLADRHPVHARPRPHAVLGAGAVPDLRDRRVARRAEDERHPAGRGPRNRHAGRCALHVPATVRRRRDGAAEWRGRLCRAPADPHSRDHGTRHRRHDRRVHPALHQPDPAAGDPVGHRREQEGGDAQPQAGGAGCRLDRRLGVLQPLRDEQEPGRRRP